MAMMYCMNVSILEVSGFQTAILGLRASHNSIGRSDSNPEWGDSLSSFKIGPKDQALMGYLITEAAQNHSDSFSKFLRAINVSMVVKAPMYWWSEFDTYKIGTTRMSSSLMHRHATKPFTEGEFEYISLDTLDEINGMREVYVASCKSDSPEAGTSDVKFARLRAMIPAGYLYTSYINTNYQTLLHICNDRHKHKLPHWHTFIDELMKNLPYFEGFYVSMTGGKQDPDN